MFVLDHESCRELEQCISDLAKSGKKDLDQAVMTKIKAICRKGDMYVERAYQLLMLEMQKEHSEVRFTTLLIMDELFSRSHTFRELLLSDFQLFLELTAETDLDIPLPPPKNAAKNLKIKTLQLVQKWYDKFKDGYKRLILGYNFLKDCKKVDFHDMEARSEAERRRQEMLRQHQEHVIQNKKQLVEKELYEITPDIEDATKQMKNLFTLLLPSPDELFAEPGNELDCEISSIEASTSTDEMLRHHGLHNRIHGIEIEIASTSTSKLKVQLNEDTQPLVENLQDLYHQIVTKYLPTLLRMLKIFTKASSENLVKKCIDLKQAMEFEVQKFKELQIPTKDGTTEMNSDQDSDFEEVKEKEGYEENALSVVAPANETSSAKQKVPSVCHTTSKQWIIASHSSDEVKDPTTLMANLQALSKKIDIADSSCNAQLVNVFDENTQDSSDSRKSRLLTKAPRRPYDIDLYHWEEKKLEPPSVIKFDSLHKFWQPVDNSLVESQSEEGVASLRRRVIEYSGEFVPVKWKCRAPLPNGMLCPRQDRQKCPFHGPIIGRNKIGAPTNSDDMKRLKLEQPSTSNSVPDWQDPTFLKEIEAATGINLEIPKKGKGRGKKSKPILELTNIKKIENTTRKRLEKKVFNKASVRRVAETLDTMDAKRIHDKFGNQWNYSFHT